MDMTTKQWLLQQKDYFEKQVENVQQTRRKQVNKIKGTGERIRKLRRQESDFRRLLDGINKLILEQTDWSL